MDSLASTPTTSTATSAAEPLGCRMSARHGVLGDGAGVETNRPHVCPIVPEDLWRRHIEARRRRLRHAAGASIQDGLGLHDIATRALDGVDVPGPGSPEGHGDVVALDVGLDEDTGPRVVDPLLVDIEPRHRRLATLGIERDGEGGCGVDMPPIAMPSTVTSEATRPARKIASPPAGHPTQHDCGRSQTQQPNDYVASPPMFW